MSSWSQGPNAIQPGLHFVATPIGAARDITLRALDILASADVLAAEDTRTLRHLMEMHGVALNGRMVLAYHDHNGDQMRPRLIEPSSRIRAAGWPALIVPLWMRPIMMRPRKSL